MAVNALDYAQFDSERAAIDGCIGNIEQELLSVRNHFTNATSDASGRWASTDINDWEELYSEITQKFARLQHLMEEAKGAASRLETTEAAYSGFNNTNA